MSIVYNVLCNPCGNSDIYILGVYDNIEAASERVDDYVEEFVSDNELCKIVDVAMIEDYAGDLSITAIELNASVEEEPRYF